MTRFKYLSHETQEFIKDCAFGLSPGESTRDLCPECGGGKSKETSFSVCRASNEDAYTYKCFRASCNFTGVYIPDGVGARISPPPIPRPKVRILPFPKNLALELPPPPNILRYLETKYDLEEDVLTKAGVAYCKEKDWLVSQVWGFDKQSHAKESKCLHKPKVGPKTLYWRSDDYCKIYVPLNYQQAPVTYIVEDLLSALKISLFRPNVIALLGAALTEKQFELIRYRSRKLVMVLDPDTWHTDPSPVQVAKGRYGHAADISGIFVCKDPKELPLNDLRGLIQ